MGAQTDSIRKSILKLIVGGELAPGDNILEAEMCERFQVSRTPFREAILQLEAVEIIERRPRSGAFVKRPSFQELVELVEYHAELEGAAAAMASRRATHEQIEGMKQALMVYDKAVEKAERKPDSSVYDLNLVFHRMVFNAAGNPHLKHEIENQSGVRLIAFFRARHAVRAHLKKSAQEHHEILAAIKDTDAVRARELTFRHVMLETAELLDIANVLSGE